MKIKKLLVFSLLGLPLVLSSVSCESSSNAYSVKLLRATENNDVYIGDGAEIENCIVESHSTIHPGEKRGKKGEITIINEKNFRYGL